METFTSGDLEFRVLDSGPPQGEAVVLLHGFPEDAHCWDATSTILAGAGYRVLAPFQRGYTPTSRPKRIADYRLQELCQDILHLMDTAGLGRAHIVGHDWGGGVAWFLADRYPERVSSLTVVSTPHPRALSRTLLTSRQLLLSWYLIFFQIPGFPEWILTRNRGWLGQKWLANLGLDATRATRYARKFANDPALLTGALNWYRALLFDAPYGFTASAVLPPTLYVWGTADSTVSGKAAQLTGQWVENSYSFCPLEGASHWIPEQLPRKLAKMITEHARKFPA